MSELAFVVPGEPVAKARARMGKAKRGAKRRPHTPKKTRAYEERVKILCHRAAVRSRWKFSRGDRFALSLAIYRTHEGAGGDLDNYVKAISDGVNEVAWQDDRYVRALAVTLEQDRANPRIEVRIERISSGAT